MVARTDTKARMVDSAITLLRERGVDGVTLDAVLADSGAPRGSIYHHFPGGRDELVITAARTATGYITHLIEAAADDGDLAAVLEQFADFWRQSLIASDFTAGCPAAGLATNAGKDAAAQLELANHTFTAWTEHLAVALERAGVPATEATSLATFAIAAIEGAILLCRSTRSSTPLDRVVQQLLRLIERAAMP